MWKIAEKETGKPGCKTSTPRASWIEKLVECTGFHYIVEDATSGQPDPSYIDRLREHRAAVNLLVGAEIWHITPGNALARLTFREDASCAALGHDSQGRSSGHFELRIVTNA